MRSDEYIMEKREAYRQEYLIFPYYEKNRLVYAYFSFVWDWGNGDKEVVYKDSIGSSVTLETLLNKNIIGVNFDI